MPFQGLAGSPIRGSPGGWEGGGQDQIIFLKTIEESKNLHWECRHYIHCQLYRLGDQPEQQQKKNYLHLGKNIKPVMCTTGTRYIVRGLNYKIDPWLLWPKQSYWRKKEKGQKGENKNQKIGGPRGGKTMACSTKRGVWKQKGTCIQGEVIMRVTNK